MIPPFLGSHFSGTYPKSRLIASDGSSSSTKTHSTNIAAIFYLCVVILNGVCSEEKKVKTKMLFCTNYIEDISFLHHSIL